MAGKERVPGEDDEQVELVADSDGGNAREVVRRGATVDRSAEIAEQLRRRVQDAGQQ